MNTSLISGRFDDRELSLFIIPSRSRQATLYLASLSWESADKFAQAWIPLVCDKFRKSCRLGSRADRTHRASILVNLNKYFTAETKQKPFSSHKNLFNGFRKIFLIFIASPLCASRARRDGKEGKKGVRKRRSDDADAIAINVWVNERCSRAIDLMNRLVNSLFFFPSASRHEDCNLRNSPPRQIYPPVLWNVGEFLMTLP